MVYISRQCLPSSHAHHLPLAYRLQEWAEWASGQHLEAFVTPEIRGKSHRSRTIAGQPALEHEKCHCHATHRRSEYALQWPLVDLLCEYLRRYLNGEPLLNPVQGELGY